MRLKPYLYRMFAAVDRQLENCGFLVDQRAAIKGRKLYKQWRQCFTSNIPEMEILKKIINSDDIVFDIGANIGEFSFSLSMIISDGLIYSFEPQNKPFKILQSVCKNMKSAVPHKLGFSSSSGKATLFIPIIKGHISPPEASVDPRFNDFSGYEKHFKSTASLQETVQLTTIDEFCETNSIHRLDFVKIDVEGHEWEILKGGSRICFSIHRPIFLIEIFPYIYQGHFENVCKYIEGYDYLGFVMSENGNIENLTINNIGNSPRFNYFFVPREKTSEFLCRIERNLHYDSD